MVRKNSETYFTTGQFAKLCKVNKRTLFHYDDIGLLSNHKIAEVNKEIDKMIKIKHILEETIAYTNRGLNSTSAVIKLEEHEEERLIRSTSFEESWNKKDPLNMNKPSFPYRAKTVFICLAYVTRRYSLTVTALAAPASTRTPSAACTKWLPQKKISSDLSPLTAA